MRLINFMTFSILLSLTIVFAEESKRDAERKAIHVDEIVNQYKENKYRIEMKEELKEEIEEKAIHVDEIVNRYKENQAKFMFQMEGKQEIIIYDEIWHVKEDRGSISFEFDGNAVCYIDMKNEKNVQRALSLNGSHLWPGYSFYDGDTVYVKAIYSHHRPGTGFYRGFGELIFNDCEIIGARSTYTEPGKPGDNRLQRRGVPGIDRHIITEEMEGEVAIFSTDLRLIIETNHARFEKNNLSRIFFIYGNIQKSILTSSNVYVKVPDIICSIDRKDKENVEKAFSAKNGDTIYFKTTYDGSSKRIMDTTSDFHNCDIIKIVRESK